MTTWRLRPGSRKRRPGPVAATQEDTMPTLTSPTPTWLVAAATAFLTDGPAAA